MYTIQVGPDWIEHMVLFPIENPSNVEQKQNEKGMEWVPEEKTRSR
jgi:hypothetical protein